MKVEVKNLDRLTAKLREMAEKAQSGNGTVVVGYSSAEAIYVHEMKEPKTLGRDVPRPKGHHGHYWGPSDYGPKFLEFPARAYRQEMARIILGACAQGMTLLQGLVRAGLFLQAESQKRVPVDSGVLKSSAFTRIE